MKKGNLYGRDSTKWYQRGMGTFYPARKSIQTEFAHRGGQEGLLFQLDAIAYNG